MTKFHHSLVPQNNKQQVNSFMPLHLKEETKFIVLGNKEERMTVVTHLDSGAMMTDQSFSSHIQAITKSACYHLKQMSTQDLDKLIHGLISSRVDVIMFSCHVFKKFSSPLFSRLSVTYRIDFKVLLLVSNANHRQ